MRHLICLAAAILISASARPASAADPIRALDPDIANASLEQLLELEIRSASRVPETVRRTPSAVTVLTADFIRRSGARSIPEVLRYVPGVQVARVDANKWAVSIRGFNSRTANKILVMIDGRSIYNPLFSGTLWETKDLLMEDIERIEIVRGPGGSSWGSNAVNGVIHIITKRALETKGGLVVARAGTEERASTDVRYGVELSDSSAIRLFGKTYYRDEGHRFDGADDDSSRGMGGFRFDHAEGRESFLLQGHYDEGEHDGNSPFQDVESRDAVLQGVWRREWGESSSFSINTYYARTDFESPLGSEDRDTAELNLLYNTAFSERMNFAAGAQYRYTQDEVINSAVLALDPAKREDPLIGGFLQAQYDLVPNELQLRVGGRIENSDYASAEFQPEGAISWSPDSSQTVWAAIGRAVRLPSRLEFDTRITVPGTGQTFSGSRSLDPEELISYEIGYRRALFADLLIDVTGFIADYDDLVVAEGDTVTNGGRGEVAGAELSLTWVPRQFLRFTGGYSLLNMDLDLKPGSTADEGTTVRLIEEQAPRHQAFVHAGVDIVDDWSFDIGLRYVDAVSMSSVPSYLVGDARIAWQATDRLELALVGQNLFEAHHLEQGGADASEVEQGVYGQVRWRFR